MNDATYALRRRAMKHIYGAKKIVESCGLDLQRNPEQVAEQDAQREANKAKASVELALQNRALKAVLASCLGILTEVLADENEEDSVRIADRALDEIKAYYRSQTSAELEAVTCSELYLKVGALVEVIKG